MLLSCVYVVVCVQQARQATNSTETCLDRQSEKEMAFHGVDRPVCGSYVSSSPPSLGGRTPTDRQIEAQLPGSLVRGIVAENCEDEMNRLALVGDKSLSLIHI